MVHAVHDAAHLLCAVCSDGIHSASSTRLPIKASVFVLPFEVGAVHLHLTLAAQPVATQRLQDVFMSATNLTHRVAGWLPYGQLLAKGLRPNLGRFALN